MIKRLIIFFLLVVFVAGGAMAAKKKDVNKFRYNPEAVASDNGIAKTSVPIKYSPGIKNTATCDGIASTIPIIEHTQIGNTWFDSQQHGSMGRMISVSSDGCRHISWMYTNGVYGGTVYRYIKSNEAPAGAAPLSWIGAQNVDGGAGINAGYCAQTHLYDGTSIALYHRPAGSPIWYTTIAAEDGACGNFWSRQWDIPDFVEGASSYDPAGNWPKGEVQHDPVTGRDYIHVVAVESYWDPALLIYERCYIADGPGALDTMICQIYKGGATQTCKVVAGANGPGSFFTINPFDSSCTISPVVAVSPVDRSVAVVYLKSGSHPYEECENFQDVSYIESDNCGNDWIDGTQWPPIRHNITNYGANDLERAYWDVAACYDYQDSLHIVWSAGLWDPSDPNNLSCSAYLYHWSKKDGKSLIASKIQDVNYLMGEQLNIAKVGISAQDPVYHPTGDSVYLYATWVQFDSADISADFTSNGDLWGCASNTGGATWSTVYNLTNTNTNGCNPGECVSEGWPSQAANMYNGNLQLMYICDLDAGICVHTSEWTDNPVYYYELQGWPVDLAPRGSWAIKSPTAWTNPPLKVTPGGTRTLIFTVSSIGNANLIYTVSTDNPCIECNIGVTSLVPHASNDVTAIVHGDLTGCSGTFIDGNIILTTNEAGKSVSYIPVQAVVTNDYYECPRDPVTYDTLENGVLSMYVNANTQEWIHDIGTFPDTVHDVFFNGGAFVATTESNDTLVGRYYGTNDEHALAREYLHLNAMYNDFWLEYSWNVSIHDLNPPIDTKSWWFEILHENVFFKPTAPDALKHCVIKFITVERHDPPGWWPSHPAFTGYDDTYIGSFMDIDAPYDTCCGQSARNRAGYDATNNIAWTKGWDYTGVHPEYNDYYAGMALIAGRQTGESTVPCGTYNVRNDSTVYKRSPWGWYDGEFYRYASLNVPGTIWDPDSIVDRSQFVTARKIDAGSEVNARASFTLVEAVGTTGLASLQTRVAAARVWVASKPLILCGDLDNSGSIDIGDIVILICYLYKGCPGSVIIGPPNRADCNSSGAFEVGDIVTMISYLFKNGPSPKCPGVW